MKRVFNSFGLIILIIFLIPLYAKAQESSSRGIVPSSQQKIKELKQALALNKKTLGDKHPDVAKSMDDLAQMYYSTGHYGEAEPLYKHALDIRRKIFDNEHPDVAASMNNLAVLYEKTGRYSDSETLHKSALEMRKKLLGDNNLDVAASLNNLAKLYDSMGRYAEGESLAKRGLEIRTKSLGEDHPDVAESMSNLARLYDSTGRYDEAVSLVRRALEIRKKVFGSKHLEVATSMDNLAVLYDSTGRYDEAEILYKQALEIRKKALGEEHPDIAESMCNLAALYYQTGRYDEAESLYKQALEIRKKVLGDKHSHLAINMHKGRYSDAESLLKEALEIRKKTLGEEHPDVAHSINNLASLYYATGRYGDAEPLFRKALKIRRKTLGEEHPDVANTLNNLALLYHEMGRYVDAESLFKKSLALCNKIYSQVNPNVAYTMNNLALLYVEMERFEDAEPLLKNSLEIRKRILGEEHPDVATGMNNLAIFYSNIGHYDEAEHMYKKALEINKKVFGEDHPDIVCSMINLAVLYYHTDRFLEAEILLKKALLIAQQGGEPDTLRVIQEWLCIVFAGIDKPEAAIFFGKQSVNSIQQMRQNIASLEKETQKSFLLTKEYVYKGLADLLIDQGRLAEASQVLAILKEEEYFDFIRRDSTSDNRLTQVQYTEEEESFKKRYEKISDHLAALGHKVGELEEKQKKGNLSADEKEQLRTLKFKILPDAIKAFNKCVDELIAGIGNISQEQRDEILARNLKTLTGLQSTLKDLGHGAVLVHFFMLKDKLRILLTTPNVQLAREYPISEKDLNRKIFSFRDTISNPKSDPLPSARELYGYLLGPVIDDLHQAKAGTIMLSLDGALRYMPMAALHDGNKYLAEEFQLVLFTEAARDKLKNDQKQIKWRVAGLGITKAVPGFCALPSVKNELEGIVRENNTDQDGVLAGTISLDEKFTIQALQDALLEAYPVLHIASHFDFKPGNESLSNLILGDGKKLSLLEIRNTYAFPNVDLLTLSACNTAMGSNAKGQEIEGFGAMAQNKGAKGVLATLWPVADRSTGLFMKTMYALRTSEGLTKAEALQKTQIQFIRGLAGQEKSGSKEKRIGYSTGKKVANTSDETSKATSYSHPYYWAPFILMGNWL
ncbi:MAG: tetratricopeptide repeat protein [Pseudomonadota bacterium]